MHLQKEKSAVVPSHTSVSENFSEFLVAVVHERETITALLVVGTIHVDLSLLAPVVLSFKLKGAALAYREVASSLQSPFVVLQGSCHLGSDLHPIRHFPPAAIVVPHQKSTTFPFDFLYDVPGDLYLCICRRQSAVFLVSGLNQATKHGIAGMAQVGVFASKDDVVHVWTID